MLCALSRWMISRAEDTGKKLPRLVERHVGRCPACGAFARATMTVAATLRAERSDLLAGVPEFAVDLGAAPEQARLEARGSEPLPRARRRYALGLRPLPAAAAAIVLVAAGALIFQAVRRQAPTSTAAQDLAAATAAIKSLTAAPGGLDGAMGVAESSLERERRVLEKSLVAAVDYLQTRLNITIERKDRSKSL